MLESLKSYAKKYKKYIVIAAVLIVLDHFFLEGEMRKNLVGLVRKTCNKLLSVLEDLIGEEVQ